jgi:NAD(P)-dependent dehydrogenase (short-subunit alcohol dehydrogenase family)
VWTSNYERLAPELRQSFVADTILNRFITPAEIAPAYLFLCETDVMTGQNLVVDGGLALKF